MSGLTPISQVLTDLLAQMGPAVGAQLTAEGIKSIVKMLYGGILANSRASERAELNTANFLADLSERVGKLEAKPEFRQSFNEATGDPDFALTFRDALVTASRTSNREKHRILSRLVTERLFGEPDGLRVVIAPEAIDKLPKLTPRQLRLLGLACSLTASRTPINPVDFSDEELKLAVYARWDQILGEYLPHLRATQLDFRNLETFNCITHHGGIRAGIEDALRQICPSPNVKTLTDDYTATTVIGQSLDAVWKAGLSNTDLTSLGLVLGIYVHEELTHEALPFPDW